MDLSANVDTIGFWQRRAALSLDGAFRCTHSQFKFSAASDSNVVAEVEMDRLRFAAIETAKLRTHLCSLRRF